MKFWLNEKYILKENKFILHEDITIDDVKIEIKKAQDLFNSNSYNMENLSANATVGGDMGQKLNEIKNAADTAIKSGDITKIKGAVQTYINEFKAVAPNWAHEPAIKDAIIDLQHAVNSYDIEDLESEGTIISAYNTFSNAANSVLNSGNAVLTSDLNKYRDTIEKITKIKKALSDDNVKSILMMLEKEPNKISNYLSAFKNLMDDLPQEIIALDIEDNIDIDETAANIAKAVAPIQKFVTVYKNLKNNSVDIGSDETDKSGAKIVKDWTKKYKSCKTKEDFKNFWDEYFNSEWGNFAKKVDEFGYVFTQELENLGFSKETNPFIAYLKEKSRIASLNKNKYIAIHNAVVHGDLTLNDIAKKGKLGDNNIIFLPDLLNKTSSEIKEYIELQKKIMNAELIDSEKLRYKKNPGEYIRSIMTSKNNELLPIEIIKSELSSILADDIEKSELSDRAFEAALGSIITKDEAQKYLAALSGALYSTNNEDYVNLLAKKYLKDSTLLQKISYTLADIDELNKKFELNKYELSKKQIETLFAQLASKAELAKNKKESAK